MPIERFAFGVSKRVIHKAIGVTNPVVKALHIGKETKKTFPVFITQEDRPLLVASASSMINCPMETQSSMDEPCPKRIMATG